jgi:hypothetical protein
MAMLWNESGQIGGGLAGRGTGAKNVVLKYFPKTSKTVDIVIAIVRNWVYSSDVGHENN